MRTRSILWLSALFVALSAVKGIAQTPLTEIPPHADTAVTTRSQVTIGTRTIPYTASAGLFPLYVNDTGEKMGSIFFIAYVADRAAGQPPRPITFLWNGGPGANSSQVHIVGYGPKRIRTPDTYPEWGPNTETAIVNHPETWLESSDLVFVDPPGTGYSRATSTQFRDILYTGRGDAEAVAEFIRVYFNRYKRWDSPVIIAGESYGATRAMLVAEALEKRRTRLAGVVLISGGYNAGQSVPQTMNQALAISAMAATAHYHKRMTADLQALPRDEAVKRAVDWARREYAPALARRDSLTPAERRTIVQALTRYTGVDPKYVDERTLMIPNYGDALMRDQGFELGHYDSRQVLKYRGEGVQWGPTNDPSLLPMMDLMQGTSPLFNSYVRDTLAFRTTLLYRGPFGGAFHPEPLTVQGGILYSDWMAAMFKSGGRGGEGGAAPEGRGNAPPAATKPPLQSAMEMNPKLLVMTLVGMYDGLLSCAAREEAVARTSEHLRSRVRTHCYAGGHMYYSDRQARRESQRDFALFVRAAIAARNSSSTR
jgi:carboxypeptidase C (cathepsin A)